MAQVIIENPILNSPYDEPGRHFRFKDDGITNEIAEGRRSSGYFLPVPEPRKRGKQLSLEAEWTEERFRESDWINRVRERVRAWRLQGYSGSVLPPLTSTSLKLLRYWTDPERERRLFFCQTEALETAIYLTEVAPRAGDAWIENDLRAANETHNPTLSRLAFKMATGTGKTVVIAMLIAWQALNKLESPQDGRFSDAFLIVTPNITIRDRLRVLLPNDPNNYYRERDLVPPDLWTRLGQVRLVVVNYHAFLLRERVEASRTTKALLRSRGSTDPFRETPDEMVRRVCREFGNKRNIIAINDEAHHCYRPKPGGEETRLSGEEKREAQKREEEARVWLSGLEAVQRKIGLRAVYDLSATPFFLKGSGYPEGTLFPWVVSDFSLIDAIESGIVKVPRVPVADDAMTGTQPTYRDLWLRIRDHLPRKGRRTEDIGGEPRLPKELQAALESLYGNYKNVYEQWERNVEARAAGMTPPVFIVVCNNTNVSNLVFRYVSGWEKSLPRGATVIVPGKLPIFNNEEHARWRTQPNTILVDSEQLERGEGMSPEFKKMAAAEIAEWKAEYRARFPGRDPETLTDEDLLREVLNTVGKPSKLGENVKCVVSVSMLTEGWDANTVTHILGVRAFGTQLLCEQVVGRGLRRMSYALNDQGQFDPEYAEVYGVPFSFIPCSGSTTQPRPVAVPTRVRALEERVDREIMFPRVEGYRYEVGDEPLHVRFGEGSRMEVSTQDVPTKTENAPIVGESSIHTLEDLQRRRIQEVEFLLAKLVLEKYFRSDGAARQENANGHRFESEVKAWRFPEVLQITRRWLRECLVLKDNVFPQYLLLLELAHNAADRIYRAIADSEPGVPKLRPILMAYDTRGSTRHVDFETRRAVYATRPDRCHASHVVLDSNWEAKLAQALEDMREVFAYIKNQSLGFAIPYSINGEAHAYLPDYIVRIDDGRGADDLLNLVLEVTGEKKKDKEAKVETALRLWVPAVNNEGAFGRWAFLEIRDPWNAQTEIRTFLGRVPHPVL